MKKLALFFLALPLFAQMAGNYDALNYAYGTGNVPGLRVALGDPTLGSVSWIILSYGQVTLPNGTLLLPFPANTSVTPIIVGSGANAELVTPSAVNCRTPAVTNTCTLTAQFTKFHSNGDPIKSGTFGLYEAMAAAGANGGGTVFITAAWVAAGGTTSMISLAPTVANVKLLDNRIGNTGGTGTSGNGIQPPSTSGLLVGIAGNTAVTTMTVPAGQIVGTTAAQILTNKQIDATEIPSGIFDISRIPMLTAAKIPTLNQSTTGNAATATAFSFLPTLCPAGQAPTGILANGNATGCASVGGSGGSMVYPGAGIPVSTGTAWTTSKASPAGAVVGTSDTQTLTNKSIDASEIATGTLVAARVPILNQSTTGRAATATALAATPSLCATGQSPLGVLANGNATGCQVIPATPTFSIGNTTTLAPGASATVANSGTDSAVVLNFGLPAGATGTQGPAGADGTGGGGGATVAIGTTTTSSAGSNATVTNSGSTSAAVFNFTIPRGNTGATGATGATGTGTVGATGPAGTIAVGSVTTGAAGSSAAVTNSGSGTAAVLNFTIPQGTQGATGGAGGGITALTGDVTATGTGSVAATLATVNSTTGSFGNSSSIPVVTVDGKGRITAITTVAASGSGGGLISTGPLSGVPVSCTIGMLYFANDQPANQQLYTCSATSVWTQTGSLGGSGALAITGGALDINPSVVPTKAAANTFTGNTTLQGGAVLPAITDPVDSFATVCVTGQIMSSASYLYVCTATNTLKRVAITDSNTTPW